MSYLKIVWNKHFDQDQDSGSSVHSDFLLCLSFGTINPPLKAICELAKATLNIKSKTINNLFHMNLMSFLREPVCCRQIIKNRISAGVHFV